MHGFGPFPLQVCNALHIGLYRDRNAVREVLEKGRGERLSFLHAVHLNTHCEILKCNKILCMNLKE